MANPLPDHELSGALADYRESIEPSSEDIDGLWSQLESAGIGETPSTDGGELAPPATTASSGAAKILAIALGTAVVGTGVALAVFVESQPVVGDDVSDPDAHAISEIDPEPEEPGSAPQAVTLPSSSPTSLANDPDDPASSAPQKVSEARPHPRAAKRRARPSQTPPPPDPAGPGASLRREAESLARVDTALRAGAHKRALELLDQHRIEFPAGDLGAEERGLRLVLLCRLGHAESKARARRELESQPASKFVWRIRSACGL